jgi:hypothetical protein
MMEINKEDKIEDLKIALVNLILLTDGVREAKTTEQELGYRILLYEYTALIKATRFDKGELSGFDERLVTEIKIFKILYELYPDFKVEDLKETIDMVRPLLRNQPIPLEALGKPNYKVALEVTDIFKTISD